LAASEGDTASSGVGDGATAGRDVDASGVGKAAKTDVGASETASRLEPGSEPLDSMASEDEAAASAVGEGVTVGSVMDACGVAKPAATDAGASETASLFEPDFGSINLAASEGDATSSGVGDGVTAGKDGGPSGLAKAAKTDAGASETASPLEPGFEPLGSTANEDDAAASGLEGVPAGRDMGACGVAKPAVTGKGAPDTIPPGKAPEGGAMTAFADPVAPTTSP
jgi:hypothetical protein